MSYAMFKPFVLTLLTSAALIACQPTPDTSANTTETPNTTNTTTTSVNDTAVVNPINTTQPSTSPADTKTEIEPLITPVTQPITILALGDSLTEGLGLAESDAYPAQLQRALHEAGYVNAKVINSGLSGETSTGLVNRLDWVLKTKPDITILTIGANDAMRGIDVATVDNNIRTAIERLQSAGSIVVLGGMQIYDNLGDAYVQSFSDTYPKLADEYNIAFIPFFLEGVAGDATLNQSDAIHPTKEGYTQIVNNNILPVLKPTLKDFVAQDTP